jgi:hypothetical protein
VPQRIDTHRFSAVEQLTPQLWKQHFTDIPLRSLLDRTGSTSLPLIQLAMPQADRLQRVDR